MIISNVGVIFIICFNEANLTVGKMQNKHKCFSDGFNSLLSMLSFEMQSIVGKS